jgi:hypothetical protein
MAAQHVQQAGVPPLPELAHSMVAGAGGLIQDEGSMLEKTRQREANDMWAI